ncbi:MAG: hypothetical protein GXO25_04595 [Euryarchaeota archaeon]|nr:hypothetical protein [Euryarchaeota archaeon]
MKWVYVTLVMVVVLLPALAAGGADARIDMRGEVRVLASHDAIRIDNDTDLDSQASAEGWAGNGSVSNPYVIENYVIDAGGSTSGIYIGNVTEYVVIRNCTIYNVTSVQSYGWGSGVMIYQTSNVMIEALTVYDVVQYGVYIGTGSNDVVVKNSHFYPGNMTYIAGIIVSGSRDVLINNTINGSSMGIWIHAGYFTKMYSNTMLGSSIRIDYGFYADQFDIPANNTVNGKPVVYLTGFRNNQSVDASNAGEVILGGASWVAVHGLNMKDTGSAYLILGSNNVTVSDSAVINSSSAAVLTHYSRDIVVQNITITGNSRIAVSVVYSYNFTARDLKIYGTSNFIYGFYVNAVVGMHISGSYVSGASNALYVFGSAARNITMSESHINILSGYGVYINSGSTSSPLYYVKITNNEFFNRGYDAIHFITVYDALIANNTIGGDYNGSNGIYVAGFSANVDIEHNTISGQHTGIDLASADSNTVKRNRIFNNSYTGITMYSASNNFIVENVINASGGYGMMLGSNSNANNIHNNSIGNSTYYGIYLQNATAGNRIYYNAFYFNHGSNATYNASHVQAYDASGRNFWNTTAPGGGHGYGNFWYDWQNPDSNNDGIVDNPYLIDGGAGAEDYYPLTTAPVIPEFSFLILLFLPLVLLLRNRGRPWDRAR